MIVFAGCGALGSLTAWKLRDHLVEFGGVLLIDDDEVRKENLKTSAYLSHHVGMLKAEALAEMLYSEVGVRAKVFTEEFTEGHASILGGLVIDTFDNMESRVATSHLPLPCEAILHVGVNDQGMGSIEWDNIWVPTKSLPRGQNPVCTHQLGRPILSRTSKRAAYAVREWLYYSVTKSYYIGRDLKILG